MPLPVVEREINNVWGRSAVAIQDHETELARIFAESGDRVRGTQDPRVLHELADTARFLAEVKSGRRRIQYLEEAMRNPKFHERLGQLMAMQADGLYRSWPVRTWQDGKVVYVYEAMTTSDFPTIFDGSVLD